MRTQLCLPVLALFLGASVAFAAPPAAPQSGCETAGDWTQHGLGGGGHASVVAFDPTDPTGKHWYVGTDVSGVFQTCDGGATWTASTRGMSDTYVQDLVVHPEDGSTLFAATLDGISLSSDAGQTWTTDLELRIGPPPPQGEPDRRVRASFSALAFDPFDADVLWAGVGTFRFASGSAGKDGSYQHPHVWRRTEVGGVGTWQAVDDPASSPWSQAPGIHSVVPVADFDPTLPGADFVAVSSTEGVQVFFWNGTTWAAFAMNTGLPHLDCRDLEVVRDPASGVPTKLLLVLNSHTDGSSGSSIYDHGSGYGGGVWYADAVFGTWHPTSSGGGEDGFYLDMLVERDIAMNPGPCLEEPNPKNMRHLALDPVGGYVYVGLNERANLTEGIWRASYLAPSWSWERLSAGGGYERCVDKQERFGNVDFDSFTNVGKVEDVAVNPVTGDVLMTTNMGAYICPGGNCDPTVPGGGRWVPVHTAITPGLPPLFSTTGLATTQVRQVQVVAETPEVWLAATYDHGVIRSDDGGTSWRYTGQSLAANWPYSFYCGVRNCHGVFRNPGHPEEWLGIFGWWKCPPCAASNCLTPPRRFELWRTTDGVPEDDSVWEPILEGTSTTEYMRARDVLFLDGEHVLVATEAGLQRGERDGLGTWTFQADDAGIEGAASLLAFDLEAAPGTSLNRRTLVALSHGGGDDGGVFFRDLWGGPWSPAQHTSAPLSGLRSVHSLVWSELEPDVVYAGRGSTGSAASGGAVLRSIDGGATWDTPGHPLPQDFGQVSEDFHVPELTSRVLPLATGGSIERVYAGLAPREHEPYDANWRPDTFGGVFHSDDGGLTWVDRSAGLGLGISWYLGRDVVDPYRIFHTTKGNGFRSLADATLASLAPTTVRGGGRRTSTISVEYYCPWKFTNLRNQDTGVQTFVERAFLDFGLGALPPTATVLAVEVEVAVHDGANNSGTQVELRRMHSGPAGAPHLTAAEYGCTLMPFGPPPLFPSISSTPVYATADGWEEDDSTVRIDLGPQAVADVQAALETLDTFSVGLRLVSEGASSPFESIELENVIGPHRLHVHYE